jgi:hypothetical protein
MNYRPVLSTMHLGLQLSSTSGRVHGWAVPRRSQSPVTDLRSMPSKTPFVSTRRRPRCANFEFNHKSNYVKIAIRHELMKRPLKTHNPRVVLDVSIGCRIMLMENLWTERGLPNGALGTMEDIRYHRPSQGATVCPSRSFRSLRRP